jgi:hypothetical protein
MPRTEDELMRQIKFWLWARFSIDTHSELLTFAMVVGAAAHLEFLSVAMLWAADGEPLPLDQYEPRMTLGQAVKELRARQLIDSVVIQKIDDICQLRNSLAHRGATYGIPTRGGSRGMYKGRHIFTDADGLNELVDDIDEATRVLGEWYKKNRATR